MDPTFFINLGNIVFFLATFPQLKLTYKNRKSLKDLSLLTFVSYTLATFLFLVSSLILGAYVAVVLQSLTISYNVF